MVSPKSLKYRFIGSFPVSSTTAILTPVFLAQLPFGTLTTRTSTAQQTTNQLHLTCGLSKQKASYSMVQYKESNLCAQLPAQTRAAPCYLT